MHFFDFFSVCNAGNICVHAFMNLLSRLNKANKSARIGCRRDDGVFLTDRVAVVYR